MLTIVVIFNVNIVDSKICHSKGKNRCKIPKI